MFGSVEVGSKFNNTFSARNAQGYVRAPFTSPKAQYEGQARRVAGTLAGKKGLRT
jgi:hypothetical protein